MQQCVFIRITMENMYMNGSLVHNGGEHADVKINSIFRILIGFLYNIA